MDFTEEFADLLARMAVSYELDATAQGKKHMGGAFLNGYQTAVYHIFSQLQSNPGIVLNLSEYLQQLMSAFDLMAIRGGVQPSIKMEI